MATYGRKMLDAALKKMNAVKPFSATTHTRRLRALSAKVKSQDKVEEWLKSCEDHVQPDEEESGSDSEYKPDEEESGSDSEYKPSECSDSGSDPGSDQGYVQGSIASEASEIYPLLQGMREQLSGDCDLNIPADKTDGASVPLECATADTTKKEMDEMTTPSRSQIRKAFERVTVAGDPKLGSKRNYRKPDYCLFCKGIYMSKISSHYLSVHTVEQKVQAILALPSGHKDRKRLLSLLQNEGNHLHNCEVLRNGCGEIIVSRRPADREASRPELYVPCSECKAWIFERSLSTHSRSCPAGKSLDTNLLRNSRMLISPFITLDTDDAEIEDLIIKMKETSKHPGLKTICLQDILIKEFCRGLLHKLGSIEEQRRKDKDNIRTKLRAVGRLLIALNEKSKQNLELAKYISPMYFKLIVNTVKEMGKHSPNLALTLGHYIKQICQLKQSLALQSDDGKAKKDSNNFILLLNAHWNNYVSAVTLRRLKLRTLNKSIELPKTSDMVKPKEFLDSEISKSLSWQNVTSLQWLETAQCLMVRILLFNKRQVSEVEEIKVSDIIHAQNSSDNEEILSQMDITEKALAKRMTVIEVRGKSTRGLRKVFVILSGEMLKACQNLVEARMYVGVDPNNGYLFARRCGYTLDGCQAMRDVTLRCPGLEYPNLIRTRLLRKYLATTIQLLDMTDDELKMVADHMGHSVTVHTDVYRLQTSPLEKAKVARALIALENGQLNKFAGRDLSSCSFEELPIPIAEQDEENQNQMNAEAGTTDVVTGLDRDSVCSIDSYREDRVAPIENKGKGMKRTTSQDIRDDEDLPNKLKKTQTKKRWDEQEEVSLLAQFKEHIMTKRNPSSMEIRQAQDKCPCLKERSIAVIKSKVNNIILGKCKGGLL